MGEFLTVVKTPNAASLMALASVSIFAPEKTIGKRWRRSRRQSETRPIVATENVVVSVLLSALHLQEMLFHSTARYNRLLPQDLQ